MFSSWRNDKKQVWNSSLTRVRERLDGAATSFGWEIRNKLKCAPLEDALAVGNGGCTQLIISR